MSADGDDEAPLSKEKVEAGANRPGLTNSASGFWSKVASSPIWIGIPVIVATAGWALVAHAVEITWNFCWSLV